MDIDSMVEAIEHGYKFPKYKSYNVHKFLDPILKPITPNRFMHHYKIIKQEVWNWVCFNSVFSENEIPEIENQAQRIFMQLTDHD